MRTAVAETRDRATALPHRQKYLDLGLDFVEGLISLYEELVERVERDFAPTEPPAPRDDFVA